MITIINYGCGNISSLKKFFHKLGMNYQFTNNKKKILNSDIVILPGVGSFEKAILKIKNESLDIVIKEFIKIKKKKLIGICLGMQLLGKTSEESFDKSTTGLGILDFDVKKFNFKESNIYLNVGWNEVITHNKELSNATYYFDHSYYISNKIKSKIGTSYMNKFPFCSILNKNNIWGCQFHPEISSIQGENFIKFIVKK